MNKIALIGNLTRDPETRVTATGVTGCFFTIAVNHRCAEKDGSRKTDYFRISVWQKQAEACGKYLAKGRKVAVVGELHWHTYADRNGETAISLDVNADEVEFLSPNERGATTQGAADGGNAVDEYGFSELTNADIPF